MTIEQYESLTGQQVAEEDKAFVGSRIARACAELESALGYSLKPNTNIYSEQGKAEFSYLTLPDTLPVPEKVIAKLQPADTPVGEVKVFPLELKDKFALVQPFDNLYSAKVVLVTSEYDFITLVELRSAIPQYTNRSWGKWIEIDVPHWVADTNALFNFTSRFAIGHPKQARFALAIDADFTDVVSKPAIQYLLADMVEYQLDPNNSVVMSNIKSESVDGHSWSKADNAKAPLDNDQHKGTVSLFAGPYGLKRNRVPVR